MNSVARNMDFNSNRGQELILVLQALHELGSRNSKKETIAHINQCGYYNLTSEDLPAYVGTNEPKYHTLLAWARKDGTLNEWIFDDERDAWGITREGRAILDNVIIKFKKKEWDIRSCYLWSEKFKRVMDPPYTPSSSDKKRPRHRNNRHLLGDLLRELSNEYK